MLVYHSCQEEKFTGNEMSKVLHQFIKLRSHKDFKILYNCLSCAKATAKITYKNCTGTGTPPKLFQLMDSDSDSRNASSNCDGIEFVSDLGSEMSELGSSDNDPEPSSPPPASSPARSSSPAPFVNDSNNDNNSIFSD